MYSPEPHAFRVKTSVTSLKLQQVVCGVLVVFKIRQVSLNVLAMRPTVSSRPHSSSVSQFNQRLGKQNMTSLLAIDHNLSMWP